MLRVIMTRRWLLAILASVAFAVACVFLGRWQWHRYENALASANQINSHYNARPVPLADVMPDPSRPLAPDAEWTKVTATGSYAVGELQLVRNRPNNSVYGYEVVVPLRLAGGHALLVDRGWVDNAATAEQRPDVPATPSGRVTVTGWLRLGEPSLHRAMPTGQLASINLSEAQAATGTNLYGAYLILEQEKQGTSSAPIPRPQALAAPDTDLGPHLAYALQWWAATPVGFVLVFFGARREWFELLESGEGAEAEPGPGQPVPARARAKRTWIWDEEDE